MMYIMHTNWYLGNPVFPKTHVVLKYFYLPSYTLRAVIRNLNNAVDRCLDKGPNSMAKALTCEPQCFSSRLLLHVIF